jgi:Protein of unknown function (DUF2911)
MNRMLRNTIAFIVVGLWSVTSLYAQRPFPDVSQGATVSQRVGISEITITYHRPGVKGRVIWGGLVPYNEVWRAGANEATTITFTDDAEIEGHKVAAGTYGFFTIPGEKEWTIILNNQPKQWGAFNYDSTKDALRFTVTPEPIPFQEWLLYTFDDLTMNSTKVMLEWEKLGVGFTVTFDTDGKLASNEKSAETNAWQSFNNYARYCLDNKVHLDEAIHYADQAIALNKSYMTLRTKAELLAQGGKYQDAVTVGEEAISMGKDHTGGELNVGSLEKLVDEWKKK